MKFEIPFKSDIYLNQTELIIPLIYKPYLKDARESLIVGLISTLIGISIIIGKSYLGIVFIILGVFYVVKAYPKFQLYNKLKNTYFEKIKEKVAEVESDFGNGIFEFKDESIKYIDKNITRDIKWTEFKGFKIKDANLLMLLEPEKGDIMIIGENEIGSESFKKIVELVKTKLK
ncbi:hypothetical protein [Winogradskyella bathintestinalis]|uniref:YcxB-like protein domain-containing protein n=1 Tax=Winogradskyella bathintestinalis TaxID=3035208 RepID=A0ABT7ZZ48_9FLAO|nr:hypothetical protein [Winogradskyella bathintestinalis]MDN3494285.1 hypothetical protein [Winogradskyella bathintestinalis]